MKVLWFEVTEPSAYMSGGTPIGGWQDSLERIVRTLSDIELTIAFISEKYYEIKVIDGITYIPINAKWSFFERWFRDYWDVYVEKMLPQTIQIVEKQKPDLIHIFGTEWPFGQIAAYTKVPVVIHIMGAIVPYNNAKYPPGYAMCQDVMRNMMCPLKLLRLWKEHRNSNNWEAWERRTWKLVNNYMGRTQWDESLSRVLCPGRNYFHVEEALRSEFLSGESKWHGPSDDKLRLVSTGCSTYWKGPDMVLKVARILSDSGVDFEWQVVGEMDPLIKKTVEKHEGKGFEESNVHILGFKQPRELMQILCSSTMYVHTAYIENSPNSICEAQCLGVPVVSTNVGGIASLIRNFVDGILVAANDPWQMGDAIIELHKDKERMKSYSENSRSHALERHKDENIKKQLLDCYRKLVQ